MCAGTDFEATALILELAGNSRRAIPFAHDMLQIVGRRSQQGSAGVETGRAHDAANPPEFDIPLLQEVVVSELRIAGYRQTCAMPERLHAQIFARARSSGVLSHNCGRLCQLQILFKDQRHEARQQRIIEPLPPCRQFRRRRTLSVFSYGLLRQRRVGPHVVGPDCATSCHAGE